MYLTVTPAYGRDYKAAKAAKKRLQDHNSLIPKVLHFH